LVLQKVIWSCQNNLETKKPYEPVASANGANAISIMVPCHRIIGSNCELTGYAGGLPVKKQLLQPEGSYGQQELQFG
jgi:methylated-DNA-[protein]-cysteine S-methyltransferase